jgi:type II secretory pathway component PulK
MDPDEDGLYESEAKNAPLDTIDELLLIDGITSEMFLGTSGATGLRDCLTIESNGYVNINSAPMPVLLALSGEITESAASSIVAKRKTEKFESTSDLVNRGLIDQKAYNDFRQKVTTAGETWHALIRAETNGSVKVSEAFLRSGRDGGMSAVYIKEVRR